MKVLRPICRHAVKDAVLWILEPPEKIRERLAYVYDIDGEFLLIRSLNDDKSWGDLYWFDAFTFRVVGTPPEDYIEWARREARALPNEPCPPRPPSVPLPVTERRRRSTPQMEFLF